jgi:hypothetical protein
MVGGGLVALAFLLMPAGILERLVSASGIPAILAAAEPPLGITARLALGVVFGGMVAGFAWFGLRLTAGERAVGLDRVSRWLQRGDVHPDAPPRPPLFANRDLGTPFLDVKAGDGVAEAPPPVERELPVDLDQPLAAFDPAAILAVPMPAPEPVRPLAPAPAPTPRPQLIDPGDRFETFELTPLRRAAPEPAPRARPLSLRVPPAGSLRATALREDALTSERPREAAPVVASATESTVHALLARLERGVAQRETASAQPASIRAHSLEDTLGDLRRLATGTR